MIKTANHNLQDVFYFQIQQKGSELTEIGEQFDDVIKEKEKEIKDLGDTNRDLNDKLLKQESEKSDIERLMNVCITRSSGFYFFLLLSLTQVQFDLRHKEI